ncbi:MAG: LegC family aminotransferase [Planctomycetota bacterium]|nr:MAG: LegC family aminotransferase [Planctomycetota bacterium]
MGQLVNHSNLEPGASPEGFIPLAVPYIHGNEWKYVKECLDTGWVSSVGQYVDKFESMLADYAGRKYAVATINGTAALHIALLVAGIRPDDEVLVSDLTFIAPVNAIRYVGAWPVFIDAEPDYWQMGPDSLRDFLENQCENRSGETVNKSTGRTVKAVMPVDILGHPVDHDRIAELAGRFNLPVIDDASESLGARYREKPVGLFGGIACLSFNGNKIITCGGGGAILTDNEAWAKKAGYLTTQAKDDPLEYIHREIGYNYRLSNVSAAIGCAQLEILNEHVSGKREIARKYDEAFRDVDGISIMKEADWAGSTFWMYTFLLESEEPGKSPRNMIKRMNERGIQTRPLWQPIHLSPAHADLHNQTQCPIAESIWRKAVSIPCSIGLNSIDQIRVIEEIIAFMEQ